MKLSKALPLAFAVALCLFSAGAMAYGIDVVAYVVQHADVIGSGLLLANAPLGITAEQVKALTDTQADLIKTNKELNTWMVKANGEIDASKKLEAETKAALEKLATKAIELTDKCLELERKMTAQPEGVKPGLTFGEQFTKSEDWLSVTKRRGGVARMELKTAIVNATGQNQPLVADMRVPGIIAPANRLMTVRDLLPVGRTASNLVQFTRELSFTNNAGPQYSSPNRENVTKPESAMTFELANAPVQTIAHWIPVSKQVLDDAPQLQSYINGRLMYGLKLEEEDQLLNGDGAGANISGLLDSDNFTAYNRGQTGDTRIDTLRRAITQAALSEYSADAIVLNPEDWEEIELTKGEDERYIMANPVSMAGPQLWGRRVVATNSITAGTFLTGAFLMGAQIWDREDAAVQISFEDGTNFVKNMATLLCEERIAMTVYRPAAFISGSF